MTGDFIIFFNFLTLAGVFKSGVILKSGRLAIFMGVEQNGCWSEGGERGGGGEDGELWTEIMDGNDDIGEDAGEFIIDGEVSREGKEKDGDAG